MTTEIKVVYGPELESAIAFAYELSKSEPHSELISDLYYFIGENIIRSISNAKNDERNRG